MVNITGRIDTDSVKELLRILSFEHAKATALDFGAKREESAGTKARANLLRYVRTALIRAGRIDVWNAALETMPFHTKS